MKDVRVDFDGELRCWNCGSKGFTEKRTFRSKALVGVGALLTKKKLKCQTCGEFNDTGSAKPFTGPASRKWRKAWEKSEQAKSAAQRQVESQQAQVNASALAQALVAEASEGATANDAQTEPLPDGPTATEAPGCVPPPPPAWRPDPSGRHESRYWDGNRWTQHVADSGTQATDPPTGL